mmetsp:Transcript_22480/g.37815  ORF Transcript_22480/g.37815 Transcript_22480/m.37815 type:complete len:83 (+) Transcript_22480:243-491(+)
MMHTAYNEEFNRVARDFDDASAEIVQDYSMVQDWDPIVADLGRRGTNISQNEADPIRAYWLLLQIPRYSEMCGLQGGTSCVM